MKIPFGKPFPSVTSAQLRDGVAAAELELPQSTYASAVRMIRAKLAQA